MQGLFHWLTSSASILALVITVGVAIFLVCCLECTKCPRSEKDSLFKRHEL